MSRHARQRLKLVKGRKHTKMSSMDDVNGVATPQSEQVPLQAAVVIGFDPTGRLRFLSHVDPAQTVFFLEKIKQSIVNQNDAKIDPSKIIVPPPGTRVM